MWRQQARNGGKFVCRPEPARRIPPDLWEQGRLGRPQMGMPPEPGSWKEVGEVETAQPKPLDA